MKIEIVETHRLGAAAARERAKQAISTVGHVDGAWNGNTFTMRTPVEGTLTVSDHDVRVVFDLPAKYMLFRAVIETRLRNALATLKQ